jgi:signal transduction histidine kinase
VHFKNPHQPNTRSEIALPLIVGNSVLGAVTVQSVEERAFGSDDITSLQTMADQLAIAIHNAQLLKDLKRAHAELLRTKTYEALATATTEAVHWIGNKALPITITVARMENDLNYDQVDPESLREDLEMIDESARQIVEVKENLLGSTRDQQPRPVLLADLWQVAAYERGVPADMFTIRSDPGSAMAMGDSTQLVRIFGNLLQNALEANARSITVEMSPAEASGFVVMRLHDDGEGIPLENQDKIWASFFTTKGAEHQGLGLAACLHVISQLEGQIILESQPGEGTTLTILLPETPEPARLEPLSALSHSLLLIDDDDAWVSFVVNALKTAGQTVARRATAQGSVDFDLILVDEALNSAPVLEVLQDLKEAGATGKILVVSAAPKVENVTSYLQLGVRDVVLKPYTQQELAELLT